MIHKKILNEFQLDFLIQFSCSTATRNSCLHKLKHGQLEIAETTCNNWCMGHYDQEGKCNSCQKCQCYDEHEIDVLGADECNVFAGKLQTLRKVDFAI